jgi:hypothetical protein
MLRRSRLALRLCALAAAIALVAQVDHWVLGMLDLGALHPGAPLLLQPAVVVAVAVYVLLMALPFCPGIEIGLALLILFGAGAAWIVYAATVFALLVSFVVGRYVPAARVIASFDRIGMHRASDMLRALDALTADERLAYMQGPLAGRWTRLLTRYRYLAVAIALNTPGNIVLGDGGGIALAAGFSRLFAPPAFAATVLLAVAPVPLAVFLLGR